MTASPVTSISIDASMIFNSTQQGRLRTQVGLAATEPLQPVLEGLATAALIEYRDTFFGAGLPTRAEDFQQRRLLLLLIHVFRQLPNERQVASLLKIVPTRARSLLNIVNVRFADELQAKIRDDVVRVLKTDSKGRKNHRNVVIWSTTTRQAIDDMVDDLNSRSSSGVYFDKLSRHPTINGAYEIGEPTLKELKKHLGI